MSSTSNFCLKGPQDQIVGFRLGAEELGHEIYDILDWADEHFSSHSVEQTDDCVYVYSEEAQEALDSDEIRAEPLSIENDDPSGNGPSSGGSSGGGSAGGGSAGNDPVGSNDGGGATAEPAGL